MEENKAKWKDHVDEVVENIPPKKIMDFRSIGKRDFGVIFILHIFPPS